MPRLFAALILGVQLLVASCANAASVDVSQTVYQGVADVSQGDRSGQTFTATRDGQLVGIRLVVQGGTWGPSFPAGSDLTVRLRKLGPNGVPLETPLATGFLPRGIAERDAAKWVDIFFDAPYFQTAGEQLAFMVHDATSGSEGWTDFGIQNGNPYPGGHQFHLDFFDGFATTSLSPSNVDFAFETLLAPEPSVFSAVSITTVAVLVRRRTTRGRVELRKSCSRQELRV